jgi:hypothetical protein
MSEQRAKVKFYADLLGQYENQMFSFNVENAYKAVGVLMKFILKGNFIKKAYYIPFANMERFNDSIRNKSHELVPGEILEEMNNWNFAEIKKIKSDLKTL